MTTTRRNLLAAAISMIGYSSLARANSFFCAAGLPYDTKVYPIDLDDFEDLVHDGEITEQETPETCWAAAIHAKLVFHNVKVSQQEVFEHVKGKVGNKAGTGTLREIIKGLSPGANGWFVNTGDSKMLTSDLQAGNPVLAGLKQGGNSVGHVVVVYGVTAVANLYTGQTFVDMIKYWDPASGVGLVEESGCDFDKKLKFMLHSWRP